MKRNQLALCIGAVALTSLSSLAQPIGLWDFNSGNLTATVGQPLTLLDAGTSAGISYGTTTSFGIANIGGTAANVAKINGFTTPSGIGMPVSSAANGGGSQVNQWTIVMDVFYPASSAGLVRALVETDNRVINADADLFVGSNNGLGVNGNFTGNVSAGAWHRIAFAVDAAANTIKKYVDGVLVGVQDMGGTPEGGIDGRFALAANGTAELFTDNNGQVGQVYVNSVGLWGRTLNSGELAALGGAAAAGIPSAIGTLPAFIESSSPALGATGVSFQPAINVVLNQGNSTVTQASLKLLLDGAEVPATINVSGNAFVFDYTVTDFLEPNASHTVGVVYSENGTLKTNSFGFIVADYQKITLPDPFIMENFDAVTEGSIPDGWTRTNHTTIVANHDFEDLNDLNSNSYLDWTVVSKERLQTLKSRIFNLNTIVLNGALVESLGSGNMLYAETDVRDDNQVQMVFSKDYDLTGKSNVFIAFESLYEQNQDNINSFEYSIDSGATWLPGLYLIDRVDAGGDIYYNADGTIDAVKTMNTVHGDAAYGTSYGVYIGAPITQALAPYISGRVNDDSRESKRIEVIRLFSADNKPKVRFRFMQAGTGSWYWGIDNVGLYSISRPVVVFNPANSTVNYGATATFSVTASGSAPLTYQWYKDGVALSGQTSATLSVVNAVGDSQGVYTVTVSNADGSATSKGATLSVILAPQVATAPLPVLASAGAPITLTVVARGQSPFTYQWYRGTTAVTGGTGATLTISPSAVTDSGDYTVAITNSFGSTVSAPVKVTVLPITPITQDLVVHLPFDTDSNDTSGRNNNGTPEIQPEIVGGTLPTYDAANKLIGAGAIHITDGQDIAMGSPDDLNFGADTDFTFSFWVKTPDTSGWTGDPSFIGNKNWTSGGNIGYVVAAQGGGAWKWNWRGNGTVRRDTSAIPGLADNVWHHIVISHDRDGFAYFYVDGNLVTTINIAGDGDINGAGLATYIGQDGTGRYGFANDLGAHFKNIYMDDFGIWRRVLTPQEAASIHGKGRAGLDLTQATFTGVEAPAISTQPANLTVYEGFRAKFTVVATGTPPLTYQWKSNNVDIAGANTSTLTIDNVTAAAAADYKVVVSNSGGPTTSVAAHLTVVPQPTAQITGQWDFENGDLSATVGAPLEYRGDTAATTTFSTTTIGGQPAKVMGFPKTSPTQGYIMPHGATANGGGTKVNVYTLIYDLMYPAASDAKWRSLFQTDIANSNDGDLFVNTSNGIGISGNYSGVIVAGTWHRVVFTINAIDGVLTKYIDGIRVGQQTIATIDSKWGLSPTALLFTDNDNETEAGFVNSIQFRNWIISDAAVLALGGATAGGIPGASLGPKLLVVKGAGNISITVDTPGTYQLQFRADLNTGAWANVGDVGAGPFTGSNPGFYRVQKVP